tara:strand:+ start:1486 stop:1659 length:174 start_codon:yes stop_codon:yes gene_type:complete
METMLDEATEAAYDAVIGMQLPYDKAVKFVTRNVTGVTTDVASQVVSKMISGVKVGD